MAVRLFVSMAMFAVVLRTASSWSYDAQEQWDSTCFGSSQSPIDLRNRRVSKVDLGELTFSSSYRTAPATQHLVNDGHTAKVSFDSPLASISGGGLLPKTQKYQYLQHHFHWGQNDNKGSEHLVNGIAAPLELHIVHWNTKYNDVTTALTKSDGVAVLGIMFKISSSDNTVLKPLIDQLPNIIIANGDPVDKPDFPSLEKLLPSDTTKFYRYAGSLTTPGCNQAVIWTVFEDRQTISSTQLAKFRTLTDSNNNPITYNNRDVQNSNRNKLYYSRPAPVTARNPFNKICIKFPYLCRRN